jgi:hypothetical protein
MDKKDFLKKYGGKLMITEKRFLITQEFETVL